jgi:hypothetical protein
LRTLFIFVPDLLEIDFGAKSSPDHTQAPTPGDCVCDCIVLVKIVLGETGIHSFVCEDWICHIALLAPCSNACSYALLDRFSLSLYSQNFWASRDANGFFVAGSTLCKMNQYSEGSCKAMSRVRNRGWVVCDQGAELRCRCFGLREDF